MYILATSIERLYSIEKMLYLNVFKGKMAIWSLNYDLYSRALVVQKWNRLTFEFYRNITSVFRY